MILPAVAESYTAFCQCPKILWLNVNKPNEAFIDDALKARFAQGNEVGDLAMDLFGPSLERNIFQNTTGITIR